MHDVNDMTKQYCVSAPDWINEDSLMCGDVLVEAATPGQARMEWMRFWERLGWWKPEGERLRQLYIGLKVRRYYE